MWIVHIYHPDRIENTNIGDPRNDTMYRIGGNVDQAKAALHDHSWLDISTFHVDSEGTAKGVAEYLATQRPAPWEVVVCEVKYQVQGLRPEVVVKQVSNKGILPA